MNPAKLLGRADQLGSLDTGKLADVIGRLARSPGGHHRPHPGRLRDEGRGDLQARAAAGIDSGARPESCPQPPAAPLANGLYARNARAGVG